MSDAKPKQWHPPADAEIAASLEWTMKFERSTWKINKRVCGACGAEYSLQPDTFNHMVCPECGALGQGLPPEMEDRVRNQPPRPFTTQEQFQQYTEMENSWWQRVSAKRKQLQGYFARKAARHKRPDALRNLILLALTILGPDAPAKAVLDKVQEIDSGRNEDEKVIQEVTDDLTIYWRNPKTGHLKKPTTFATFQNRVSKLR